jgi:hypothetical protein
MLRSVPRPPLPIPRLPLPLLLRRAPQPPCRRAPPHSPCSSSSPPWPPRCSPSPVGRRAWALPQPTRCRSRPDLQPPEAAPAAPWRSRLPCPGHRPAPSPAQPSPAQPSPPRGAAPDAGVSLFQLFRVVLLWSTIQLRQALLIHQTILLESMAQGVAEHVRGLVANARTAVGFAQVRAHRGCSRRGEAGWGPGCVWGGGGGGLGASRWGACGRAADRTPAAAQVRAHVGAAAAAAPTGGAAARADGPLACCRRCSSRGRSRGSSLQRHQAPSSGSSMAAQGVAAAAAAGHPPPVAQAPPTRASPRLRSRCPSGRSTTRTRCRHRHPPRRGRRAAGARGRARSLVATRGGGLCQATPSSRSSSSSSSGRLMGSRAAAAPLPPCRGRRGAEDSGQQGTLSSSKTSLHIRTLTCYAWSGFCMS